MIHTLFAGGRHLSLRSFLNEALRQNITQRIRVMVRLGSTPNPRNPLLFLPFLSPLLREEKGNGSIPSLSDRQTETIFVLLIFVGLGWVAFKTAGLIFTTLLGGYLLWRFK